MESPYSRSEGKKTICVNYLDSNMISNDWMAIAPPNSRGYVPSNLSSHPVVKGLKYFTTVIFESKIYIIGGMSITNSDFYSDRVFAYDLKETQWLDEEEEEPREDMCSSMNIARAFHSAIVAPKNKKIYVFGGKSTKRTNPFYFNDTITSEEWGEVYNIETNEWTFLPPPPLKLYNHPSFSRAVYYEKENKILVFKQPDEIFAFDVDSGNWEGLYSDSESSNIDISPWSTQVALLNDVIFWHLNGKIHAYNLVTKKTLRVETNNTTSIQFPLAVKEICIDSEEYGDPNSEGYAMPLAETYLFGVGQKKFCVVWHDCYEDTKINCSSFSLTKSDEECLHLDLEDTSAFLVFDCVQVLGAFAF